jgi:hypothetical protein
MPGNIEIPQLPADLFSAVCERFPSGPQECVRIFREFIDLHLALLAVVNNSPKDLDNRAGHVTRALTADFLVLRLEQLNHIARQFRVLWEADRQSPSELARCKGKLRDINSRLTNPSRILQPVHQKARLEFVRNVVLNLRIQRGQLQYGWCHRNVDHSTTKSVDRSIVPAQDRFRTIEIDDPSSGSRQVQATVT